MAAEQPPWEQCSQNDCTGERLPATAWCLAHAAKQAPEAFIEELKRISAEGSIAARGVVISAELLERLLAAAPRKDDRPTFTVARFDEARFEGMAGFIGVRFEGAAVFVGARFQGEAWFAEARFEGGAGFDEASFQDNAWFAEASFQRSTGFRNARFGRGAVFHEARFQGGAHFDEASFKAGAGFDGARFQGQAVFVNASFHEHAGFGEARFQGLAQFLSVDFEGGAGFGEARFQDRARFSGATFQRTVWFDGASFQGGAEFDGASFEDRARFSGVSFQGETGFGRVRFQGVAEFGGASFERATHLGPLRARQLVLDGAVFGARVQLDITAAALCARRARFPAGVHLRLRYATVHLDDADLAAPAILAGVPSPFPELGRHQELWDTRGWERLPPGPRQQRWRPRLLSIRRADVAGLRLADVDLRACRFAGAHNLDRLRIEGAPLFARTPGWWRARRKTLAEEQHWRTTRQGRWLPGGWYPRACQPPDSPKPEGPTEAPAVVEPARLAALYRELRKGREDAKDEPGAADFYYGEMEMRRSDASTPWAERLILSGYWLVAGYGLRGLRALAALGVVVVALAGLFHAVGFVPARSVLSWWDSLLYTAGSTLSINDDAVQLTAWGKLLRILLRLLGPLLLGLALLSVRNRVKR
jgi:uncharacterized protein YjbI with pentapeptide repeats